MKDLIEELQDCYEQLCKDDNGAIDPMKVSAVHRLNEMLLRLENRYQELVKMYENFIHATDRRGMDGLSSEDAQLLFVDYSEAYFQKVYSTLSTFLMVLNNFLGKKEYTNNLPIGSVKRFLERMVTGVPSLESDIKLLEYSRAFRAKAIDHPQQHSMHDWFTQSLGGQTVIVYFTFPRGSGGSPERDSDLDITEIIDPLRDTIFSIPEIQSVNPYSESYSPAFACSTFYVSPPYLEVHNSIKAVIKTILLDQIS